jgi:3-oxoacyl-[acyl-carrier-protein] synthase III
MQGIFLDYFGHALGDIKEPVAECVEAGMTFSTESQLLESGFEFHHRSSARQSVYDLARNCLNNLATQLPGGLAQLQEIDALLYATCLTCNGNLGAVSAFESTRDVKHLMDFPASHLHGDFGLDKAFVMGVNQTACTSLLGSIRLARSLLLAEPAMQTVLCLTADRFPPGAIYEQGFNLISDGAAACILNKTGGPFRLIDCHHLTNGAMAQANDDETAGFYFNYTHRLVCEILDRNTMTLQDLQWIVPQNTNVKAWQVLSSILRWDYQRVLMPTRTQIGHCISGDNIINLKTAAESGCFESGDRILMPMAGFGLNWSCLLLEKT